MLNDLPGFYDSLQVVFERVLKLKIVKWEECTGEPFSPQERQVAALPFYGDYNGTMSIILKAENIESIAKLIMQVFELDIPIETELVYAEILNILAGNLAMELQKKGARMNIGLPDNTCFEQRDDGLNKTIQLLTDIDVWFKFQFGNIMKEDCGIKR